MAKDYRVIYCTALRVSLKRNISSIHHIDQNRKNCSVKNLVAIPEELHRKINCSFERFPKIIKNIIKTRNYGIPRKSHLEELEKHIQNYKELLKYIEIRDMIKENGLAYTKERYYEEVEEIYE